MNISTLDGPGVDDWLRERLKGWGYETTTDVQTRAIEAGVAGHGSIPARRLREKRRRLGNLRVEMIALREKSRQVLVVRY